VTLGVQSAWSRRRWTAGGRVLAVDGDAGSGVYLLQVPGVAVAPDVLDAAVGVEVGEVVFLRHLCTGLGIEFRAGMIDRWREPFLNANQLESHPDRRLDPAKAWVNRVATSRGIEAVGREPLDISILPPALRDHVSQVALPTYELLIDVFYVQENLAQYRLDRGECPER
jgi:hypothetical protein